MFLSMTGYGSAVREAEGLTVRVEIKSLNSRGLDLSIRLPRAFSDKEISLRTQLTHPLQRGKVSVNVETEYSSVAAGAVLDRELLLAYYNEARSVAEQVGASTEGLLPAILSMNNILCAPAPEPGAEDWKYVEDALQEAFSRFESFRKAEGEALRVELESYINTIGEVLKFVAAQKDNRIERVRDDLREKLRALYEEGKLDENRFEQEMIYYAEKLDITEEIVRLTTHLHYFLETVKEDAPGKKLGFIAQEIGREINTIGSKANDASIQRHIVVMKEELEKIKEQVLNVL